MSVRTKDLLYRLWLTPKWVHYSVAFGSVIAIFWMRAAAYPIIGDKPQLLYFSIAVAMTAFIGGLWPGLSATALSLVIGIKFIVLTSEAYQNDPRTSMVGAISFAGIWLFISIVCDLARNAAIGFRQAAGERDQGRDRIVSILHAISDGFCGVDREYIIFSTNPSFRELLGLTDDVVGKSLWSVVDKVEQSEMKEHFDVALATGKPVMFDTQVKGDHRWFHIRAFPDRQGLFLYIQDVSHRKEVEANRERLLADERMARSNAEQASRLKDEFVATVSHELRTPLTTILGWSEVLGKRATGHPEYEEGLSAIERSTRLQAQLIDDLLDMSRIATGKLRLQIQVVDLEDMVTEAIAASRAAAANKAIKIDTALAPGILVRGDHSRLTQVISNLVSNAVKFSHKGGTVWVTLTKNESNAIITVRDEGVGIDPDFMPVIFDRFRQANASITRRHGGLGLGLAIVRQLTELHGGSVSAKSEGEGKGSTFTVSLPISPIPALPAVETVKAPAARIDGVRVLVVDDDEGTRALISVILQDAGAKVVRAASAYDGLQELKNDHLDLVLSDIGMPEMDGYQFMEAVRASGNKIPAVALTAFARAEDRRRALDSGYQEHLSKPVDVEKLIGTVAGLTKSK